MPIKPDHCEEYKYVNLVFLGFFFIHFIFTRLPQGWEIVANIGALSLFLVLYFWNFHLTHMQKLLPAIGMLALGFALAPINLSSNVFFPYAGHIISQTIKPRFTYIFLVCFLISLGIFSWLLKLHISFSVVAAIITIAVTLSGVTENKINIANEKLKRSQEEVEQLATLAERERIARDLHDLLGHTLSVIILKAELSKKLIDQRPEHAKKEISEVETISRDALRQIRLTINNYRHTNFQEELKCLSESLENSEISIVKDINLPTIPIKYETPLCMILKEAITNIIRHAKASLCQISLNNRGNAIELCISDNGIGYHSEEGNGIRGIRERVAHLNGQLNFQSENGTKITITLPAVTT